MSAANVRRDLVAGEVRVSVPATSANLGPGYDALGLALGMRNAVTGFLADRPAVTVIGQGRGEADRVPTDETNLVYRSMAKGFEAMGISTPPVALTCENNIPHGRGLGSSSSAIVAGIGIARALVRGGDELLPLDAVFQVAAEIEGHPDNVAPATYGGLTIAYDEAGSFHALNAPVDPRIGVVVFVPETPVETKAARGLIPGSIPHADAAANTGRAALLVAALGGAPDRLLDATRDWLHQDYREPAMPETLALVRRLRREGHAAVVSGAGPAVLTFVTAADADAVLALAPDGWQTLRPALESHGLTTL